MLTGSGRGGRKEDVLWSESVEGGDLVSAVVSRGFGCSLDASGIAAAGS